MTDDLFFKKISDILSINNNIKVIGSFAIHGDYKKICDLDLNDKIILDNDFLITFKSYITRLKNDFKENKIYLIKAYFDIPYMPLKNILDKMGYIDGNLLIHNNTLNNDDIDKLPQKLKDKINKLFEKKSIDDIINMRAYINSKLYPKWSLNDLLNGKLLYYDTTFKLSDFNFSYFYIEVIYNKIRVSNYINIIKDINAKYQQHYITVYSNDIVLNSKISYYRLLKKFKNLIKWLYYTHKIKDDKFKESTIKLYKEVEDYITLISKKYNKYCNILNLIDIIKTTRYQIKYADKLDAYTKKYNKGINKLENKNRDKYLSYLQNYRYKYYLEKFFKIL